MTGFSVNQEFYIWDALVSWRDYILNKDFYKCSKGHYLSNVRKLVEADIVDVRTKLIDVDASWLETCKKKIDSKQEWAKSTRIVRKSRLNSFYVFIKDIFDVSQLPYQRHPQGNEIDFLLSPHKEEKEKLKKLEETVLKHVLSNISEKPKTKDLCPIALCNAMNTINKRDSLILWFLLYSAQPLEKVLNLKKENLHISYKTLDKKQTYFAYVVFDNSSEYVPGYIVDEINRVCGHAKTFLFETREGRRVTRTQLTRNLKKIGRDMGLDFELTPKILNGFANIFLVKDKERF